MRACAITMIFCLSLFPYSYSKNIQKVGINGQTVGKYLSTLFTINNILEGEISKLGKLGSLSENGSKKQLIDEIREMTNEVLINSCHLEDIVDIFHNMSYLKDKQYVLSSVIRSSRKTEDAIGLIVNGYCKEVLAELPMEFAVEETKLLSVSLEGSVG